MSNVAAMGVHIDTGTKRSVQQNTKFWFQSSAAKWTRTVLFPAITQCVVVINYRRFGTTYRSLCCRGR